jgi:hypothetical protein
VADELILWGQRTLSGTDRFGRWVVTDGMENWWGSPDTRGDEVDRPDSDGELDLPIYNQARLLTLSGHLHTTSHEQMHEAAAFLSGPMAGRFQVQGHGPTLWADAKRNSGVKFLPVTDTFAQWQLRLKMVDPRKYGDTWTWAATVGDSAGDIAHNGNYPAIPRFTVAGNMPGGYTLTIKGQVFNVTAPLVPGHPHSIDYGDGRLRIDGAIAHGGLGYGFTPLITPGVATALSIEPGTTGTATATLTLIDTYM